ncbi:MAG TPA: HDOD domain-containing protein [Candidatus Sumerlaeota bacterium]|nr:HDOD domain-containing protein [Candidatus Sumerlaeota bacterium]HOR28414.1 HDOD domain-containing protein [Candidatus Sumerlaeota bacterium]HPK04219.1 HDOD domain-containing protein [Candidatus Sumerlaeota bacterium]
MIPLDRLIKKVEDLPPLPDIVVKLLHASRDPNVSTRDMVELIKHDPALTIKVLRLCNSSYYGLPRKINSIQEALVYIGTDTLVNFVLAGCLSSFYQQAQDGYGLSKGELWRHSVGCAIASQRIASRDNPDVTGQAFTAGLIHDIGKILLDAYVGQEIETILRLVEEESISFAEAEKRVLGFSHTEAGCELARHWNLPEPLIEAIAYHQMPDAAKLAPKLVAQVHLGNILCISFGIGVGSDGLAYTFHPHALAAIGMEVSDLFRLSLDVHDDYKKAEELIGLAA